MNVSNSLPLAYSLYTRQVLEFSTAWGRYRSFSKNVVCRSYEGKNYLVCLLLFTAGAEEYYFINDSLSLWSSDRSTYYVSEEAMTSPLYKEIILDFIKLKHIESNVIYVKSLSPIAKIKNYPIVDFCKYKLGKLGVTKKKKSSLQKVWDSL